MSGELVERTLDRYPAELIRGRGTGSLGAGVGSYLHGLAEFGQGDIEGHGEAPDGGPRRIRGSAFDPSVGGHGESRVVREVFLGLTSLLA